MYDKEMKLTKSDLMRNFVFTINNYTNDDLNLLSDAIEKGVAKYIVIGFEIGKKENNPHIHGYCELAKRSRWSACQKWLPRAWAAHRKGTAKQARDYCRKDGNWLEWGTMSNQGKRNDIQAIKEIAIEDGMREVTHVATNFQQIRIAEVYLTYNEEPRNWKPEVIWIWGPTGTGKSRVARLLLSDNVYVKNTGEKWWPGYDGHPDIILDDFRDSWWPITYMLALLDRYEFQVEFKGGYRQLRAKRIIITSCMEPKKCYANTGERIDQLLRRIDLIESTVP